MGRASLVIVAGFIFAFGYMNYSLTTTGSRIVDNYSASVERTTARNATNSAIHYYLKQLSTDRTLARTEPYAYDVNLDGGVTTVSVQISKFNKAQPDTFLLTASAPWGEAKKDEIGDAYRNTTKSYVKVSFNEVKLPPVIAAVEIFNGSTSFNMSGSPTKSHGEDSDTSGYMVPGGHMLPAFVVPTGSDSVKLANAIGSKKGIVSGAGNPPYASERPDQEYDINKYVTQISAAANQTLAVSSINQKTNLGTVSNPKITVLAPPQPSNPNTSPSVTMSGNPSGAGILIIKGDLKGSGSLVFKGIVIVVGGSKVSVSTSGSISIYGALMVVGGNVTYSAKGNGSIYYSSQAITMIKNKLSNGKMVNISWWE